MSDYQFSQKTMKSLHERIEKLEFMANWHSREINGIHGGMNEVARAVNDINHRLRNASQAAKSLRKEMEEDNE